MPKYIIEREIADAGNLNNVQLKEIAQHSCCILKEMGPKIQWIESYVTDNKVYCIYIAPDVETIKEHAHKGNFPANSIAEVKTVISPATAENN